jgi:hypothetical protein
MIELTSAADQRSTKFHVSVVSGASCGNPYWGYRHADKGANNTFPTFPTLPTIAIEALILQALIGPSLISDVSDMADFWRPTGRRKC